jgi:hypothetical protein
MPVRFRPSANNIAFVVFSFFQQKFLIAPVAQWIARPPPKGQVAGSIPARGAMINSEI